MKRINYIFLLMWVGISACRKEENLPAYAYQVEIPSHFPAMTIPVDNPITAEKIKLGKMLFEDVKLSKNNTVSCASCHHTHLAFSDSTALSLGLNGGFTTRNSPPIFNIGYHPYYFRDGGALTLELQVIAPIENHVEMDMTIVEVCEKLNLVPTYKQLANTVFGTDVTPFVVSRSIATYMRSLISGNSRYDELQQGNDLALSDQEKLGLSLFEGKANCIACHSGFNFTDYSFQNNGLYLNYPDMGRKKVTNELIDEGKFKVASLRNLSFTAPYMFDGSIQTLEEVIEHYNSGGKSNWNQSEIIQRLNLTELEKEALLAFLLSLNDGIFVNK